MGTLTGRSSQRPAAHLGETAREQERARRVAGLNDQIAAVAAKITVAEIEIGEIDAGRHVLDAELAAALQQAETRLADAGEHLRRSRGNRTEAEKQAAVGRRRVEYVASSHRLPATEEALREVERAIDELDRRLRSWTNRLRELNSALGVLHQVDGRLERAEREVSEAEERLAVRERQHRALAARLHILEDTVGVEYRDILSRIAPVEDQRRRLDVRRDELDRERVDIERQHARLDQALATAEQDRRRAEEMRGEAHERFVAATRAGFPEDPEIPLHASKLDGVSAVLEAARSVAARASEISGNEREQSRAQHAVFEAHHSADQRLGGRVGTSPILARHRARWCVVG